MGQSLACDSLLAEVYGSHWPTMHPECHDAALQRVNRWLVGPVDLVFHSLSLLYLLHL